MLLRSILSVALLFPALAAQASGCEAERGARSANSNQATKVVFDNRSGQRVWVYWLNYDGRREFYSEVQPGASYVQDTFMTHPWVVTDSRESCIMMFRPMPGATIATVTD